MCTDSWGRLWPDGRVLTEGHVRPRVEKELRWNLLGIFVVFGTLTKVAAACLWLMGLGEGGWWASRCSNSKLTGTNSGFGSRSGPRRQQLPLCKPGRTFWISLLIAPGAMCIIYVSIFTYLEPVPWLVFLYSWAHFGSCNDFDGRWEEYTFPCKKNDLYVLFLTLIQYIYEISQFSQLVKYNTLALPLSYTYTKHMHYFGTWYWGLNWGLLQVSHQWAVSPALPLPPYSC